MSVRRFHFENRLRSFARMITGNYRLKVFFTGDMALITRNIMYIPPLEESPEAFSKAKFLVAHECGHDLFSDFDVKADATKKSVWLGDILNSLEDARIERLMVERFPGLERLFDENVNRVISEMDYSQVPLSVQILHGLYLIGKGLDTSPLSEKARRTAERFERLVKKAVKAKDSREVMKIAKKIYKELKQFEDEHESFADMKAEGEDDDTVEEGEPKHTVCLPDMVIDLLDKYKLDPNYDNMGSYPMFKDENVDDEETEHMPHTHPLCEYLPLIRNHTAHQNYLIQHLRSIVETRRRRTRRKSLLRRQSEGTLDMKSLWKIPTGDIRVMKRRRIGFTIDKEVDPNSLAVYILVDESTSMLNYNRIGHAKEAVAVLGEVLNELNIPFAITGYTVMESLVRLLYKRFDEDYTTVRTRLVEISGKGGTYTQEHILYALRKLSERRERKKILLVITDSESVESPVRFEMAKELAEESGVELLGLGINTSDMQRYFDRFVVLNDLQRFGEELLKLLKEVLLRG